MEEEEDISLSNAKFQIDVIDPKLESLVFGVFTLLEFIAKKAQSSQPQKCLTYIPTLRSLQNI